MDIYPESGFWPNKCEKPHRRQCENAHLNLIFGVMAFERFEKEVERCSRYLVKRL